MQYLWDTNILLHYIRQSALYSQFDKRYNFFEKDNQTFLSIISMGEIQSLAFQLNWGPSKRDKLQDFISKISLLEIYEEVNGL